MDPQRRLRELFRFGYDVFISYSRSDGLKYAQVLYVGLNERGLAPFIDVVTRAGFLLPPLRVFDQRNDLLRSFTVKALVDFDYLQRLGVDAIDRNVNMLVLGVVVQAVHVLVTLQATVPNEECHGLAGLPLCRVLVCPETEYPVVNWIFAARPFQR